MFPDIVGSARRAYSAVRTVTAKLDGPTPNPQPGPAPTRPVEDTFEPGPTRKKTSDELLREYTVAPTEMTKWPKVFGVPVPGAREVTQGEAAMLDDLGWLRAKGVRDIAGTAEDTAKQRFPPQGSSNGHADAFRHAYANALLTKERGEEWTAAFTTAHEQNPDSTPLSRWPTSFRRPSRTARCSSSDRT
jgi:hypothetical protein